MVGPVEPEHFGRVGRVDQEERGSVRDVVVVHLDRLVPVRRAAGGVEESDVVGVGELLGGRAGELAEPNREHRRAQCVLERLAGAEVGGERKGANHLRGTNRSLRYRRHCCRLAIACCHGETLLRFRRWLSVGS